MGLRTLSTFFAILVACSSQTRGQQQRSPQGQPLAKPDFSEFIPGSAKLVKQLKVDFDNNGDMATVLAFASDTRPDVTTGVRVLKYGASSGWTVVFEETDRVTNGAGASDAINIDKVRASTGKEGVVVVQKSSGAGTATAWHVLASVGNKISRLDPPQSRAAALDRRGYQDWGYNGVISKDGSVIETLPGYSQKTARCCPDQPSIEMLFQFSGSSIVLKSVKELPFSPAKH